MSRDKQIEEIDLAVLNCYRNKYYADGNNTEQGIIANAINDILPILVELKNGYYRKASEVAREIFEELLKDITHGLEIARSTRKKFLHNIDKNNIWVYRYDGEIKALEGMEYLIAELKKKYTEGGE